MLMQLSKLIDALGYRVHIAERSKYGRRAHPSGEWGYLREYMATYASESDPEEVIRLFESVGADSDLQAGRWLLRYDELIP